jgi:hypothetical protein
MSDNNLPSALERLNLESSPAPGSSTPAEALPPYYSPNIQEQFESETRPPPLPDPGQPYAKIDYAFDKTLYAARREARLSAGGLESDVPPGWPKKLEGPLIWTSSDFPSQDAYTYYLTEQDREEIREALSHFKTLGKSGKHVNKTSFPLPTLDEKLRRIKEDVYDGRGFAILRGLDIDRYGDVDLLTVYLGLTSYVGELRGKQKHGGDMLSMSMSIPCGP